MVTINGEQVQAEGMTVSNYLEQEQYNLLAIAVELNELILPKSDYDNTILADGDVLEVVQFVGGG